MSVVEIAGVLLLIGKEKDAISFMFVEEESEREFEMDLLRE